MTEIDAGHDLIGVTPFDDMNRTRLRRLLDKHFNESELRDLAWDLEIDFENLPAIAKKDKARELISRLERTNRMDELLTWIKEQRPDIPWQEALGQASVTDPQQALHDLCLKYDALNEETASDEGKRARLLDSLMGQMRDAATVLSLSDGELQDRLHASSEGIRMSALAYLYDHPQEAILNELLQIEGAPAGSRGANEEYHALLAIHQLVAFGDLEIRPKLYIKDQLKSRLWHYKLGFGKIRKAAIERILDKLEDV